MARLLQLHNAWLRTQFYPLWGHICPAVQHDGKKDESCQPAQNLLVALEAGQSILMICLASSPQHLLSPLSVGGPFPERQAFRP
jgi:hypothetical protein